MVKDAKSRGTDLIDTLIRNNAVESSLGDPIMIQAVIDYLQGSLNFIPKTYSNEYKNKIFNEVLRCLHITQDMNDINIMKPKLISTGTTTTNIDKLRRLMEGTFSNLTLDFTNEEKWRILFRIQSSDLYSTQQKEMYMNHMKTVDQTDTAKDWCVAIESLTQCDEKLEQLWKEVTNIKERTYSYHKIEYLLIGFNSSLSASYKKHKYMQQYFEVLP